MIGGKWHGKINQNNSNDMKIMEDIADDDDKYELCEHCRCTCDQNRNQNSQRSFYAGKVEPDRDGL